MTYKVSHITLGIFCLGVCVLSFFALTNYPGHAVIYAVFTIVLNVLLILGFTRKKIFFDTFIGIFFWLGFWLKLTVRVGFMGGKFQEPIGQFNGTGPAYDQALLVVSCGVIALLMASLIRRKFFFSYENVTGQIRLEAIFTFYRSRRKPILVLFASLFVIAAVMNVIFGVYQRGSVPRTILPFGLSGIYTWLLLFGLASVSAVILDCEFRMNKNPYLASVVSFLECFFSSTSMLSRGIVLNGGALIIGLIDNAKRRSIHMSSGYKLTIFVVFVALFVSSLFVVNHIRKGLFFSYSPAEASTSIPAGESIRPVPPGEKIGSAQPVPREVVSRTFISEPIINMIAGIKVLLIDRWVGIEGVMAVSSYQGLGWDLWKRAWQEKYLHSGTSMFDRTILKYEYLDIHLSKYHFINLPGILAFFYYPGSFTFLFFSMFLLGFLGAGIEMSIYRLSGGNIMLCSLIAQVVAYRYAHFGYVPYQSYLLFGSIYFNVLIIFFLNKSLFVLNNRSTSS
ncbi:MAG: hypothetical protein ABFD82_05365 [Syntrophaceae bacterium]